jgi:hypothetical protein
MFSTAPSIVQVLRLWSKLESDASLPSIIRNEGGVGDTFAIPVETVSRPLSVTAVTRFGCFGTAPQHGAAKFLPVVEYGRDL